jgi:hypothetical protein
MRKGLFRKSPFYLPKVTRSSSGKLKALAWIFWLGIPGSPHCVLLLLEKESRDCTKAQTRNMWYFFPPRATAP